MAKRAASVLAASGLCLFLAPGCGGPEPVVVQGPPPLALPGVLTAPDGLPADVSGDSAAVVYYWLPLDGYAPTAEDLDWIRGARERGFTVFPIQFDETSRNAAQAQVNDLGISLPIYLADSSLDAAVPDGILPVAVLFTRQGTPRIETGAGCVERLLGP